MKSKFEIKKDDYYFKYETDVMKNAPIALHYHPYPEIYLFVKGNVRFIIEGATYTLNPYDIIIVPAYTLHQPIAETETLVERYVFNPLPTFFEKMQCMEYNQLFDNLCDFKYKFPGHHVSHGRFLKTIKELEAYTNKFENMESPVVYCKLCELLHILNSTAKLVNYDNQNPTVQGVIDYIDHNFSEITKISDLSMHFNYSPNHLGYIFKTGTGMTIMNYVNLKKLENTKMLYQSGYSLTNACLISGFTSYYNFAYTYRKIYNAAPKSDLK